jgi:formylmethanofuran dehydrogenase subunit E
MEHQQILFDTQRFHGHKCWASTAGVRAGLAALRTLGVERSPGTQLFGIIEIGEDHAAMCFGDGIQYTTGCTFGKGNIRKQAYGKLAFTLIEKATGRAVRVSYKPTLQPQIGATAFMQKRAAGIYPNEIPEEEVMEPVNLIWNAPEEAVLVIEPVFDYPGSFYPEVMGFERCARCGELVALPYLRVANGKHYCIPCSDYDR